MKLEYVPLLQLQRDLYRLPRGFERFREYIRTMVDPDSGDLNLPLVAMNPMGKDHLQPFLDRLLELGAEREAASAAAHAQHVLEGQAGAFKVCLVVSDDLLGGWTNRYTAEFGHRFSEKPFHKRGWITGLLWTSETYMLDQVREEVLLSIFRAAYILDHGYARTLGEMLAQEGHAMAMAGATDPALDPEDLAYTGEVLDPCLGATDQPTLIAALYGDPAAHQLGYRPLGLSTRAGLALALQRGRSKDYDRTR